MAILTILPDLTGRCRTFFSIQKIHIVFSPTQTSPELSFGMETFVVRLIRMKGVPLHVGDLQLLRRTREWEV